MQLQRFCLLTKLTVSNNLLTNGMSLLHLGRLSPDFSTYILLYFIIVAVNSKLWMQDKLTDQYPSGIFYYGHEHEFPNCRVILANYRILCNLRAHLTSSEVSSTYLLCSGASRFSL